MATLVSANPANGERAASAGAVGAASEQTARPATACSKKHLLERLPQNHSQAAVPRVRHRLDPPPPRVDEALGPVTVFADQPD
jgi:hypothetical protein